MTLHERITAAVEKRLAVAQAAVAELAEHGWTNWGDFTSSVGFIIDNEIAWGDALHEALELGDPARIIRDCRRDLKVLARHRPDVGAPDSGNEKWCYHGTGIDSVLIAECPELLELAEAYEIGVDDGDG